MKRIAFVIAAVVLLIATSCTKEESFESCMLSVTEVTEHRISGHCAYTPNDNESGYAMFITYTDQLTDEMRDQMLDVYHTEGTINESSPFAFDDLASGETYYIMAISFREKGGDASIINVKSLKQATLINNDSRVSVNNITTSGATFNVQVAENNYDVEKFKVDIPDGNFKYSAIVSFYVLTDSDESSGDNCYSDGKLVCPISLSEMGGGISVSKDFYGTDPDGKKYKALITVIKERLEKVSKVATRR